MSQQAAEGLSECGSDWGSAFCITKSFQTLFSLGLIVWIIIEMVNYYHYVRVIRSSFIFIVEIVMLLTLTFNIAFSVYHTTYPLLYIEIYFYNMYFVILSYYLIFNVFKRIKWMRALIACLIGFLSLIYLLILIDSFIQNVQTCKQISYLIMNSVGIFICILMFVAYRYNQVKEKLRIQKLNKVLSSDQSVKECQNQNLIKMKTPSKVDFNQPFKLMWFMIICNIICRLVDLGQSLAFKLQWNKNGSNTCPISQNQTVSSVVNLVFVCTTMYLGFVATIYAFRQKRKAKDDFEMRIKSPSDFSSVISGKNILQMVGRESFQLKYDHDRNGGSNIDNLSDLYDKFGREYQNSYKKQGTQEY